MRLVTRLTVAYLVVVILMLALHELRQLDEAQTDFEHDMDRAHFLVASTLADTVELLAARDGLDAARRTVAETAARHAGDVRIRWVCLEGEVDTPSAPVHCSALETKAWTTSRTTPEGATRRFTLAPVRLDGKAAGAIEVSESPAHEGDWVRQHVNAAVVLAVMTAAGMALAAFVLGWWLVARPTRALVEKARAVGRGELEPDLTLPGNNELSQLANEMNAMCRSLGDAKDATTRETAARLAAVEQLRRADRLAGVGRLASGLAHELGTPLNVIEARAGLIIEDTDAGSPAQNSARVIVQCSEQVTKLVRQLLDYARPRKLERSNLSLDGLARTVTELVEPLAGRRRVTLEAASPAPVRIDGDEGLLQQALTNVVVNALHACSDGGHVRVSAQVKDEWATVSVTDDGVGMTDDVKKQLLEPFFTTKAVGEGTGLGLPITASILEDHGGFLGVESAPGKGSTLTLHIPLRGMRAS